MTEGPDYSFTLELAAAYQEPEMDPESSPGLFPVRTASSPLVNDLQRALDEQGTSRARKNAILTCAIERDAPYLYDAYQDPRQFEKLRFEQTQALQRVGIFHLCPMGRPSVSGCLACPVYK